jgi:hypothetical protein
VIAALRLGAWLALAALTGAVLSGCGGSHSPKPSKANVAESEAISHHLDRLPGVVRVDGGYARDLENPGSASFSIGVRDDVDLAAIADKTIEAVWRSKLDPIGSMSVLVGRYDDPSVGLRRHADFRLDKATLEHRYGPRP